MSKTIARMTIAIAPELLARLDAHTKTLSGVGGRAESRSAVVKAALQTYLGLKTPKEEGSK